MRSLTRTASRGSCRSGTRAAGRMFIAMSEDEGERVAGVRGVERAYDEAWCAGDLDGVLACLAADAVIVNPRGEVAGGIDEIREIWGSFLTVEAAGSSHSSTLDRISFVTEDVAVVDGRAAISQANGALLEHASTDVVRRTDGRWRLAHVRAYGLRSHTAPRP